MNCRHLNVISILLCPLVMVAAGPHCVADSAEAQPIQIGSPLDRSRVPALLRQGTVLPPQSVSVLDVSDDGRFVAVGTIAFRHVRNFWLLSAETGEPAWGRYVETWARTGAGAVRLT
jgi:hypothetical protein